MCDIAPFQMKCEYEDYDCVSCAVHHLYQAFSNLLQSIPIVKRFTEPYKCPQFEIPTKQGAYTVKEMAGADNAN